MKWRISHQLQQQHEAAKLKKLVMTADAADETKFRIPILLLRTNKCVVCFGPSSDVALEAGITVTAKVSDQPGARARFPLFNSQRTIETLNSP